MSGRRRNRTTSTTNPPAKANAAPKPVAQTAKSSVLPTSKSTPAQPKPTPPPPAKPTPSAKLRQEWKGFEVWLHTRRAERDNRINEKLKEIMSSKGKSRWGKPAATQDTDVGAFEDKLNEELAEQAREEWLKRVAAIGLEEDDWTDITEQEMAAVENAFVPQARATRPLPTVTNPSPPVFSTATSSKAVSGAKPNNARSPYAATVEEEPSPPGAWEVPSQSHVPAKGMTGRTRAETPILTRVIPTPNGSYPDKGKSNGNIPTPESLWDMHMGKKSAVQETDMESLWNTDAGKGRSTSSPQSSGGRWSPFGSTPPTSVPSSKLPTPELLWAMNVNRNSPQVAHTPAPSAVVDGMMGMTMDPFNTQSDPESLWEAHVNKKSPVRPPSTKPAPPASPAYRTPAPTKTPAPMPIKAPTPSKPLVPSKLSMSVADAEWNTPATVGHSPLHQAPSELTTPVSSTYAGNYNYISPVFLEMEDDEFPRLDDPLPESAVEETIHRYYGLVADMEIALRRSILSGEHDDGELEQLLSLHITTMEKNARKVLSEWNSAREAVIAERQAEEQRQRALEESRRRQVEAKRLAGKKKGKWALPIIEDVAEEPPVVEPPLQSKKKPIRKGTNKAQQIVLEEAARAKAATPSFDLEDEGDGDNFWQPQSKLPPQTAPAKSMFSFFAKSSPSPAPGPPVPTPWPQTQMAPQVRAPQPKSALLSTSRATNIAPEPSMTPWQTVMARKQEATPVVPQQQQSDPWAEDNTDESEEGASWTEAAMSMARGGVASAWDMVAGGARPAATASRPSAHTVAEPESMWGGGDFFPRSTSRAAWPEESRSGADPRFSTWRPPREADYEGSDSNVNKMAELALENLVDIAGDGDPDELKNAMSMFSKASAVATSTRKRNGSNAYR